MKLKLMSDRRARIWLKVIAGLFLYSGVSLFALPSAIDREFSGAARWAMTATIVMDIVAAGLLWWFAGRSRPTSAAIVTTFAAVGLCVVTGLATTIIALDTDVVMLVPAVIVYVFGTVFVMRCVASMKHAAAASTV
jgi:hypothetical protein